MATFLANEINTTERDIMGSTAMCKFYFAQTIKERMVFEDIFSGT